MGCTSIAGGGAEGGSGGAGGGGAMPAAASTLAESMIRVPAFPSRAAPGGWNAFGGNASVAPGRAAVSGSIMVAPSAGIGIGVVFTDDVDGGG